jgi:hypothetical protein
MTTQFNPIRVRICSHITQSTFLHLEDALSIGKLRLFAGSYQRGKGITTNAHHFLDAGDAGDLRGQIDEELFGPEPAPTPSSQFLHYQDGALVNSNNENERKAFLQYGKDKEEDPNSLATLRDFYWRNQIKG